MLTLCVFAGTRMRELMLAGSITTIVWKITQFWATKKGWF